MADKLQNHYSYLVSGCCGFSLKRLTLKLHDYGFPKYRNLIYRCILTLFSHQVVYNPSIISENLLKGQLEIYFISHS